MLIGSDLNAVWDVFDGLEGRGDEAIDAGDIVKNVSPMEIVVLPLNLEGSKEELGVVEVVVMVDWEVLVLPLSVIPLDLSLDFKEVLFFLEEKIYGSSHTSSLYAGGGERRSGTIG
jgi:hypothetical protein